MPCQSWPLDIDVDDHQSYSFVIAVLIMKQKLDNKINESERGWGVNELAEGGDA